MAATTAATPPTAMATRHTAAAGGVRSSTRHTARALAACGAAGIATPHVPVLPYQRPRRPGGGGVLDHQIVGLLARPLGKLGVDRDVAAEQRLNSGADVADDAARAHRQSAHHAEVLGHAIPRNIVGRGDDHMSLPTKWPGSC